MRMRFIVVGIVVIIGVTMGLASQLGHSGKSANTAGSPSNSTSASATTSADYAQVCNGARIKGAAPYTSSTPHPTAVFIQQPDSTGYESDYNVAILADKTIGQVVRDAQASPKSIQLVACLQGTAGQNTGQTCPYTTVNLPVYSATYHLTIYTAQTHAVVLSKDVDVIPIATTVAGRYFPCSYTTSYDPNNPRLYYFPSSTQVVDLLTQTIQ